MCGGGRRGTLSEKHVNDDLLQAGVEAAAWAQAFAISRQNLQPSHQ